MEVLTEPDYLEDKVYPISSEDTWMSPLIRFLGQGVLPDDKAETRTIQCKVVRYALRDGNLYKRSYLDPWVRCVTVEQGQNAFQDIHEGLCDAHVDYRMLVKKTLFLGYF